MTCLALVQIGVQLLAVQGRGGAPRRPGRLVSLPVRPPSVWAVLVDGFNAPGDSFNDDTEGMYAVLRGFGVEDSRIRYLRPCGPQLQGSCTHENLEDASAAIASEIGKLCTQRPSLLVFRSSHGGDKVLLLDTPD